MNYNYFPVGYQPVYPYQQQNMQIQPVQPVQQNIPQPQQTNTSPFKWVDGESSARSMAVEPGQSVMLMDSNANVFYIKSADPSGMPLPLRIFDYTERTQQVQHTEPQIQTQPQQQATVHDYITREEFEKRIAEILETKKTDDTQRKKAN